MSLAPIVVLAIGNPSRGDDALGPQLAERLRDWLEAQGREDVEVIEDFQLQVEHALDLEGRQQAIFIDAGTGTPAPYAWLPVTPTADFGHSTHAISPGAVLHVYTQTVDSTPPPATILCIPGEDFELGEGLSAVAEQRLELAFTALVQRLSGVGEGRVAG